MRSSTHQCVREHATIIAALRYWSRKGIHSAAPESEIASEGDTIDPLSEDETNTLAENLNCGNIRPLVVLRINGGAIHQAISESPVHLVVLDEDTEGGDRSNIREIDGDDCYVTEMSLGHPNQDDADQLARIETDLEAWREGGRLSERVDIECTDIGREDQGIDGHDVYKLVFSRVDEMSETQAKEWLLSTYHNGEPTPNFAALSGVSVTRHPTKTACWIGVLSYRRDV